VSQHQPIANHPLAGGRQVRVRLDRLRRWPALNILGVPELVGLASAALLAVFTIFAYVYFLIPAQSHRESAKEERDLLQTKVRSLNINLGEDLTLRAAVDKIKGSMQDFESNKLAMSGIGRMSLYTNLNDLIRSNGLRNTAGPSYATLAPAGAKNAVQATASAAQQSSAKWQTIYPGIAVTVTVEGPYQNVRHFVRDIETSREFLIINAVELEGVTQSGSQEVVTTAPPSVSTRPGRTALPPDSPPPGTRGTLVSLRLEMATYFQRGGGAAPSSTADGN